MASLGDTITSAPSSTSYENVTWTPEEIAIYLSKLSEEAFQQRYPVVIYLSTLAVVGFFGNSLVLAVYALRFPPNATRVFVLSMGVCDLTTNVLGLPLQIATIRVAYNTYDYWLCRGFFTFATLTTQASGLLLVLVAIDRYRRICWPLKRQMNAREALKLVLVTVGVSSVIFAAFIPLYGLHTIPTDISGVSASMCWADDAIRGTVYPLIYKIVLLIVFFGGLLVMGVAYFLIARRVWKQSRKRNQMSNTLPTKEPGKLNEFSVSSSRDGAKPLAFQSQSSESQTPSTDTSFSQSGKGDYSEDNKTECFHESGPTFVCKPTPSAESSWLKIPSNDANLEYVKGECSPRQDVTGVRASAPRLPKKEWAGEDLAVQHPVESTQAKGVMSGNTLSTKDKNASGSRQLKKPLFLDKNGRKIRSRTTLMMATLTALYVINWLPHLVMRCIRSDPVNWCENWTECGWNTYAIVIRSYYINSAVNAFVYSFCNARFRLQCHLLFQECFKKRGSLGDRKI